MATSTAAHLPVFVYGTLRPGHGNYRQLLAGRTIRETPATVSGLALYGCGIPYAVPTQGATTVGALIHVDASVYAQVLHDLDSLEGYRPHRPDRSHYVRASWIVATDNGDLAEAWIYLAGPHVITDDLEPVPNNDWALNV